MIAGLLASLWQVPFLIASCVLGGFALWGWRRTGATGALLIAVSSGLAVLRALYFAWHMMTLYSGGAPWSRSMLFGALESLVGIIAEVLLIVGVALLLRRLPPRK